MNGDGVHGRAGNTARLHGDVHAHVHGDAHDHDRVNVHDRDRAHDRAHGLQGNHEDDPLRQRILPPRRGR